jgi:hypothetical protein
MTVCSKYFLDQTPVIWAPVDTHGVMDAALIKGPVSTTSAQTKNIWDSGSCRHDRIDFFYGRLFVRFLRGVG